MRVKKTKGKAYGMTLTAAEKRAMNLEIQRQLAEYDARHNIELDAIILWELHEQFGFGPKRLKKFYDAFSKATDELIKRYEMEDAEKVWLCTYMLKRYGIDIEKWHSEAKE